MEMDGDFEGDLLDVPQDERADGDSSGDEGKGEELQREMGEGAGDGQEVQLTACRAFLRATEMMAWHCLCFWQTYCRACVSWPGLPKYVSPKQPKHKQS